MPRWSKNLRKPGYLRKEAAERLPVHLEIRFRWLRHDTMFRFEKLYYQWRYVRADSNTEKAVQVADELFSCLYPS
ncbi:MAG: hypothetical protein LUD15_11380 [Bacteroides sp.]|nr:hypothetical protein [Bacteroides sp.]